MTTFRIVWKLLAIFLVCILGALLLGVMRGIGLLIAPGHIQRENWLVRGWAKTMTRIVGMRVETVGAPPRESFLLVSNHLSYVDVLAYMSHVDARLLSKAEVKHWPLLGPLARMAGTLFVDRTRRRDLPRVIKDINRTLATGRGVVFFPEGTSSAGMEVKDFRASLFEVAAAGNLEVSTAALRYRSRPGERPAQWSVAWWGDMPFAPHFLGLLRLSSFEAHITFNEQKLRGTDRKQLAADAQAAVTRVFEPLCSELGPDELFGEAL